jgi:hypothetical protein
MIKLTNLNRMFSTLDEEKTALSNISLTLKEGSYAHRFVRLVDCKIMLDKANHASTPPDMILNITTGGA